MFGETFEFLVVEEVHFFRADLREVEGGADGDGVGFLPCAVFPEAAAGGDFADIDFRVEVSGEGEAVGAGVAVDDVEGEDFVEVVFGGVGAEDVGSAWVEAAAEEGGEAGLLEFFLIGPLPFVFELGGVEWFVVGGVDVVGAGFEAGVHDGEVLVGEGDIDDDVSAERADEAGGGGDVICVDGGRFYGDAFFFPDVCGDGVAFGDGAAGEEDVAEDLMELGAFVSHDASDAAGTDDQGFLHGWDGCRRAPGVNGNSGLGEEGREGILRGREISGKVYLQNFSNSCKY